VAAGLMAPVLLLGVLLSGPLQRRVDAGRMRVAVLPVSGPSTTVLIVRSLWWGAPTPRAAAPFHTPADRPQRPSEGGETPLRQLRCAEVKQPVSRIALDRWGRCAGADRRRYDAPLDRTKSWVWTRRVRRCC
jgi:hypothetical protein